MKFDPEKLKEILIAQNYVTKENMETAQKWAESNHASIEDYLLTNNLISKSLLGQALAEYYKVNFIDLSNNAPSREQVIKLPEILARKYRAILYKDDPEVVVVTDNPLQEGMLNEIVTVFPGKKVSIALGIPEDIDPLFVYYLKPLETRFAAIISKEKSVAPEILEEIFNDAIAFRGSDIHFEPHDKEIIIRFRIDGVLHEAGRISKLYYENILNRIKVSAHLRTDEHFAPQDGSIQHAYNNQTIAMRVSIVPTLDGEKVVIRILSEYIKHLSIENLGLTPADRKLLMDVVKMPFGMVLVTGPTGSGKTTTLYSLLNVINNPNVNITTIEDPVEYKIFSINQIQVDPKTNLTFATGLKSILRQDPDIILVGEIRDLETAEIAVNASLTGHMLFSTFHANDAATAVPRLLEIGIEPFLVASTLQLIIAERLVRRICERCRVSTTVKVESMKRFFSGAEKYFPASEVRLYMGKGCGVCGGTGYHGRIGIFEFLRITQEMQDLILTHPSTKQIWELGRSQGGHTLFEDGLEKVKNGVTTIEELLRVAAPDNN